MSKIKKKVLKDELPGWCWTLMDSEMLVLVSWSLALWSSSFSWSRLGGQLLQKLVFVWKPTEVSLAEQSLSLSSLVVILCRRVHQEQLEGSEMAPQCWSWVLDHLVAADRMSRFSQEKGVENLGEIKCISSVPLLWGLRIQDRFAAVEDLELSWIHVFSTFPTKCWSRLMRMWRTDRLVLECGGHQTCCSILS